METRSKAKAKDRARKEEQEAIKRSRRAFQEILSSNTGLDLLSSNRLDDNKISPRTCNIRQLGWHLVNYTSKIGPEGVVTYVKIGELSRRLGRASRDVLKAWSTDDDPTPRAVLLALYRDVMRDYWSVVPSPVTATADRPGGKSQGPPVKWRVQPTTLAVLLWNAYGPDWCRMHRPGRFVHLHTGRAPSVSRDAPTPVGSCPKGADDVRAAGRIDDPPCRKRGREPGAIAQQRDPGNGTEAETETEIESEIATEHGSPRRRSAPEGPARKRARSIKRWCAILASDLRDAEPAAGSDGKVAVTSSDETGDPMNESDFAQWMNAIAAKSNARHRATTQAPAESVRAREGRPQGEGSGDSGRSDVGVRSSSTSARADRTAHDRTESSSATVVPSFVRLANKDNGAPSSLEGISGRCAAPSASPPRRQETCAPPVGPVPLPPYPFGTRTGSVSVFAVPHGATGFSPSGSEVGNAKRAEEMLFQAQVVIVTQREEVQRLKAMLVLSESQRREMKEKYEQLMEMTRENTSGLEALVSEWGKHSAKIVEAFEAIAESRRKARGENLQDDVECAAGMLGA